MTLYFFPMNSDGSLIFSGFLFSSILYFVTISSEMTQLLTMT